MDHSNVPPTSTSDNAEEARAPGPPFHTALQPSQVPMYIPNPVPYPFTAASAQSYSGLTSVPPVFSPSLPSYFRYDDPVLQRNVGPVSQPIAGPISQHTMSQLIAGPMSRPIATPMSQPIATPMLQPIAGARPLSAGPYNPHGHPVPYPPRQVSSLAQDPVQISSRPHPQEVANPSLIPFQGYQLQPSPSHAKPVSCSSADSLHSFPAPAKQISSQSSNPIGSYRPSSPYAVPYSVRQVASSALNSSSRPVRRQQEPPDIIQEMLNKVNREPQSQTFTIWSGHLTDVDCVFSSGKQIQCTVTTSQREINSEMKPELWPAEMLLDFRNKTAIDSELRSVNQGQVWTVNLDVMWNPQSVYSLNMIMENEGKERIGIVKPYQAMPSCPLRAFLLIWNEKQKQFVGLIPIQQETFAQAFKVYLDDMEHVQQLRQQQWQRQQQQQLQLQRGAASTSARQMQTVPSEQGMFMSTMLSTPTPPQQQTPQLTQQQQQQQQQQQKADLERLLTSLETASYEQQQQLFARIQANPEQQQQLLSIVQARRLRKQQEQQQQQGTSVPSTSNPILPQQQTQQRLQQEPRVRTPEEKQARLEKILRFLQSASPEQQQQLFMKLRATPEQQQHLLARAEALKTQKQQQQLQESRKRQARILLDEALERGYVLCHIDKCITMGNAGAGKTHVTYRLFKKDPPAIRSSTALAEAPIRAISRIIIGSVKTDTDWFQVSSEEVMAMLAQAVQAGVPMEGEATEQNTVVEEGSSADMSSNLQPPQSRDSTRKQTEDVATVSGEREPENETDAEESSRPATQVEKNQNSDSPKAQMPVAKQVSPSSEEILKMMETSSGSKLFLEIQWVHFIDTGGQRQFHHLFSSFVKNATAAIFVIKLSERLDQNPMIEYYQSGQLCGSACPSALSISQILQHCVQTVHSQMIPSSVQRRSKFIVVGTHRDLEHTCTETRAEKNKKLLKILRPVLRDGLVFYGQSTKEVIFPINAKNPEEEDWEIAALIRKLISDKESAPPPFKIPVGWFLLEQDIRKFAADRGRRVASKNECHQIAARLKINDESLEAALAYLHKLNIYLYYPDFLPEVVFCESQVVLDKITELVAFSYQLRRPSDSRDAFVGWWLRFRDEGVVTREIFHQERFSKYYVSGLFTPDNLLHLLQGLLIVAPTTYYGYTEYFMPSLLPSMTQEDISKYRLPATSTVAPLLMYFPDGCAPNGIFCALVVYLLSTCKWKISYQQSCTPSCVACNCIEFQLPIPGSVTLIDSFTHFEIHPSIPESLYPKFCPETRQHVVSGLEKAFELNSEDFESEVAFFCDCKEPAHPGTLYISDDGQFLKCTENTGKYCQLEQRHIVWLDDIATLASVTGGNVTSQDSVDVLLKLEPELDESKMCEISKYLMQLDKTHLLNLGVVLGLSYQKLKGLQDSPTFQNDLVAGWILKQDYVLTEGLLPTWRNLVIALRDKRVGQMGLANDIARDKGIE